jgi:hypothetical protein
MRATIVGVALVACAVAPQVVLAQLPVQRNGAWFDVGGGAGWARVSCDICRANRNLAPALRGAVGVTLSPSLLIGADGMIWRAGEGSVTELLGAVAAVAYWYPNPMKPLKLKGGLSYTSYRASDEEHALTGGAFGPTLGLSYEWRLGSSLGLAPYVTVHVASLGGELKFDGAPIAGDLSLSSLQFGAALVKH